MWLGILGYAGQMELELAASEGLTLVLDESGQHSPEASCRRALAGMQGLC